MTIEELKQKLSTLSDDLRRDCAKIIAETSTEYFKGRFRDKAYDARPWRRTALATHGLGDAP